MRYQAIFLSNADYSLTYKKASEVQDVLSLDRTQKGLISIKGPDNIQVLVSPKGKVELTASNL
jgi:hypothetical protein